MCLGKFELTAFASICKCYFNFIYDHVSGLCHCQVSRHVEQHCLIGFITRHELLFNEAFNPRFDELRVWLEHLEALHDLLHQLCEGKSLSGLHDLNDTCLNSVSSIHSHDLSLV